jgi:CubicO group peptidase (beta-lactamase class C family)
MRGSSRVLARLTLLTVALPSLLRAQSERVDSIVTREMRARNIPGVAVAVVDNGRVVLERAYGIAHLEWETPLYTDAVFELASITKQFTAAAIMLLVQDGKVGLDQPITTYIDNAPDAWRSITVRQLLTHTAGLDISGLPRLEGSAPLNISTKVAFDHVAKQPSRFPPGQEGWYSDAGYLLLGLIIEKASGETYRQFMQRRIFAPLQMTHSSILDKQRVLKGRVPTYSYRDNQHLNWRRDWDFEVPSFFGVFSTLSDLAKWDVALRGTAFLADSSLAQMWTPAKLANGNQARVLDRFYGFGFELDELRGHRYVGHGGASGTYMLRFVDQPLTVIVLTNLDMPSGRRHPLVLARAIAGAFRPALVPPEALAAKPDPAPAVTQALDSLLADVAADRPSAMFSETYTRWWSTALGRRSVTRRQLQGVGPLSYVDADDVSGKPLFDAEPLERLVYYRAVAGDRTHFITVGLTKDGKVGRLDIPFQ